MTNLPTPSTSSLTDTVGRLTRRGQRRLGSLPGVSAAVDVLVARHCIDLLAVRLKEDPADPRRHVWLAEALLRMRRDLRAWAGARGVLQPSSLVVRAAVRRAATLGSEDGEDLEIRLLRRAFALARARLGHDGADAVALHVLARVYLAQGMLAEALQFAERASTADSGERADAYVTAARVLRRLGRHDEAARAAESAVAHGSTLGYEVLARLLAADAGELARDPGGRAAEWMSLRRKVLPADRARYAGAFRTPAEVARAAGSAQRRKAEAAVADAVELTNRALAATTKEKP